jgi:tripartite-type tricarboxylate transporter receptor subunit TctC
MNVARVCVLLLTATAAMTQALAQYAAKPVRLIVPFPPGGGSDAFARIIGVPLSEALGRPVVVENRAGAGGNIGAEVAAKSSPDGHTVLVGNVALAYSNTLFTRLGYDLVRDFAPVSLLASTPQILVVHPSLPVKSLKELIALARTHPGQLDYVSGGSGSPAHLAALLFMTTTFVKMNHIAYKGGTPSLIGLMGGEGSVGFPTLPTVIQHLTAGKLRGIAVTSVRRSPLRPDLPTLNEAGVKEYVADIWYGLLVPTSTPNEAISRLHTESAKAVKRRDVKERFDAGGLEQLPASTPEQFGTYIGTEIVKWAKVVKISGARAD